MRCEMDHSHPYFLFPLSRATTKCYTAVGWRRRLEPILGSHEHERTKRPWLLCSAGSRVASPPSCSASVQTWARRRGERTKQGGKGTTTTRGSRRRVCGGRHFVVRKAPAAALAPGARCAFARSHKKQEAFLFLTVPYLVVLSKSQKFLSCALALSWARRGGPTSAQPCTMVIRRCAYIYISWPHVCIPLAPA
eukprot:scaffold25642_cov146-Isochrysis_galbana.AAC.4